MGSQVSCLRQLCAKTMLHALMLVFFKPRFLGLAMAKWGKSFVLDKLEELDWRVSTSFSGLGCFESAALSDLCPLKMRMSCLSTVSSYSLAPNKVCEHARSILRVNKRKESANVELRSATDFDRKAQRSLCQTFPGRCVRPGQHWTPSSF